VPVNVFAVEEDLALARAGHRGQKAEQGSLAGAVGAVKQNCVSRPNAQLSAGKRREVAKILGDVS
jgi:hypothetical protein